MHVSEFLYTSEKTSLFVFLPSAITLADFSVREFLTNGISNLIERLSTEQAISTLRNLLDSDTPSEDAGLSIDPIFDLYGDMPMRALLRDLSIEELLKPDAINLDSFFVDDDSVHLGNAMHRIRVKVTENYTAAGAVNVIYTGQGIPSEDKRNIDKCDFPCVWLIYDKQRRNVLFAGAFNDFDYYINIPSPPPFIHEPVDIINISL
ncbi:antithrombin-iii-like isoform 1 protein [Lasius niger]|uniref:Antithrombin-iii-like isoform 1 protein n=1 Tax=Lasius niger TaxID=67767 RepID=A0A0J7MYD9_LASNI|nr:antithrombin-iii-like isoform 1 protein [Lasius niger]